MRRGNPVFAEILSAHIDAPFLKILAGAVGIGPTSNLLERFILSH